MRKSYLLVMVVLALIVPSISASSIYTAQINFEPGSSRAHSQTITLDSAGNITVVGDSQFNVTSTIPAAVIVGNNLTWTSESSVTFEMTSPANCTEGNVYRMPVYVDSSLFSSFTFICVPDNKVVDYKGEYGHGDTNYMGDDYRYLPAGRNISLFNLIRVFTYGSYLNPNENGLNASITCTFPNYLVMTRQNNKGTSIVHGSANIQATFSWTNLFGNWFRVAPLEQEITSMQVGGTYNISCNNITYFYTTGRINAKFTSISFTARNTSPINITAAIDNNSNGLVYTLSNKELYPIYDVEFLWTTQSGDAYREVVNELQPNETVAFEVFLEGSGTLNLDASFVPVWQHLSLKPTRYAQAYSDSFNFGSGSGSIKRVEEAQSVPRITLTHYKLIQADDNYHATLIFEVNGIPTSPDSSPELYLIDPNGTTVDSMNMTLVSAGVYNYSYDVSSLDDIGIWRTETYTVWQGNIIPRIDYWEMQSNPTQLEVLVISRCEDTVCADISIKNEGETSFEYIYSWWLTDDQILDYDDDNVTDRGQASKLIQPGDTYIVTQCLTQPNASLPGLHYFRVKTYYGEYSYATDSFDSGMACTVSTAGGDGGFNERTIAEEAGIIDVIQVKPTVIPFLLGMLILFFLWRRRKKSREHNMAAPHTTKTDKWVKYTERKK